MEQSKTPSNEPESVQSGVNQNKITAIKNTELNKRIKTAIVGVTIFLLLLAFGGSLGAAIIATVIATAMVYEFSSIVFSLQDQGDKRILLSAATWIFHLSSFWFYNSELSLFILFFLILITYFLKTARNYHGTDLRTHFQELMYATFGFFFYAVIPSLMVSIRILPSGLNWIVLFFVIVWSADTFAYFVGRKIGKRKLYEHISPKKSLEGYWGGIVGAILIAVAYKIFFFQELAFLNAGIIACIIAATAPVGDLAESFLKRAFDKKDSSQLLPGHGGFLDRFDSVVFCLPIMLGLIKILA